MQRFPSARCFVFAYRCSLGRPFVTVVHFFLRLARHATGFGQLLCIRREARRLRCLIADRMIRPNSTEVIPVIGSKSRLFCRKASRANSSVRSARGSPGEDSNLEEFCNTFKALENHRQKLPAKLPATRCV